MISEEFATEDRIDRLVVELPALTDAQDPYLHEYQVQPIRSGKRMVKPGAWPKCRSTRTHGGNA